jgi:hypothetical protein
MLVSTDDLQKEIDLRKSTSHVNSAGETWLQTEFDVGFKTGLIAIERWIDKQKEVPQLERPYLTTYQNDKSVLLHCSDTLWDFVIKSLEAGESGAEMNIGAIGKIYLEVKKMFQAKPKGV